jgi:O-antigen ligase
MRVHTAAAVVAALFLASSMFGHTVALRLLLLGTGLILAALVAFQPGKDVRLLPAIWLPFLLWGAWALLSLTWSIEPDRTWKEWRNEVFYTGTAIWICYIGAQARNSARIFPLVVGAAAALACTAALFSFRQGWEFYADGWHGGPGDHSHALVVLMPCAAIAGWYAQRRRSGLATFAAFGLMALLLASAYATLNRAIWLAFAVQFVVLGGLLLMRRELGAGKSGKARVRTYAWAAVAFLACATAVLSVQINREETGAARALDQDPRLALYPRIIEYIGERPLLGYGFGRGLLRESLQAKLKATDINLWHAHNVLLEALVQVGVPGLILLLFLVWAIGRCAWRYARDADEFQAACGIALLGVVAGMLARNMTDFLLVRQNALLFWGVVGALLALGTRPWPARS